MSPPQQPCEPIPTTTTQPTTIRTMILLEDIINKIIITYIINTASSLTSIRRIIQSAQNSVYPKIFTLTHNLITHTTLLKTTLNWTKNTSTIVKPPPKRLESQSNQRTRIHRHVKVEIPKNLQQQSSRKTEAKKVNATMEQLDELDGNGHRMRNNINHFAPLYESYDKEGTHHGKKPRTTE